MTSFNQLSFETPTLDRLTQELRAARHEFLEAQVAVRGGLEGAQSALETARTKLTRLNRAAKLVESTAPRPDLGGDEERQRQQLDGDAEDDEADA
jgi:hypothetical protein